MPGSTTEKISGSWEGGVAGGGCLGVLQRRSQVVGREVMQGEDSWEYYKEDMRGGYFGVTISSNNNYIYLYDILFRCDIRFTKVGFEMHEYNLEQLNKPASHVIIK